MTDCWTELTLSFEAETFPTADDAAFAVMEAGASGVEHSDGETLRAYFERETQFAVQCLENLNGITIIESRAVPNENWMEKCQELWKPVTAGALQVVPIASDADLPSRASNMIFITPGTGFGTGHHSSTQLALELLQHARVAETNPTKVLDLGTGSGILAIAACQLYPCTIDAVEIDPLAIENASANVHRHGLDSRISLQCGTIDDIVATDYDVVCANIYAEVLAEISLPLANCIRPGGCLILSGIASNHPSVGSRTTQIDSAYSESAWHLEKSEAREGWQARLLIRR